MKYTQFRDLNVLELSHSGLADSQQKLGEASSNYGLRDLA